MNPLALRETFFAALAFCLLTGGTLQICLADEDSVAADFGFFFRDLPTSAPVHLNGGNVRTWKKGSVRTFVANGDICVRQGDFELHGNLAVLRFQENRARATGMAHLDVYIEKGVGNCGEAY
jgi:hypothetical protein